jgi:hypothetical protein
LHRILAFVEPRGADAPPLLKEVDLARVKSQWSAVFGRRHSIAHLPASLWIVQKQTLPPAPQSASSTTGQKRMRSTGNMEERRDTNKLRETVIAGDSSALEKSSPAGAAVADIAMDPKFARMLGSKSGAKSAAADAAAEGTSNIDAGGGHVIDCEPASVKASDDAAGHAELSAQSSLQQPSNQVSSSVLSAILGAQRAFGDRSGLGAFSSTSAPVRLHCSTVDLRVSPIFGAPFERIVHSKFCSKKHPAVASSLTLVLTLARSRLQRLGLSKPHDEAGANADRVLLHCGKVAQALVSANVMPHLLSTQADNLTILNGWAVMLQLACLILCQCCRTCVALRLLLEFTSPPGTAATSAHSRPSCRLPAPPSPSTLSASLTGVLSAAATRAPPLRNYPLPSSANAGTSLQSAVQLHIRLL